MLKPNSVVIVDPPENYNYGSFKLGERLLFLGEIENMPGHCIVVNAKGKVLWGYHTENFREPTEDEM